MDQPNLVQKSASLMSIFTGERFYSYVLKSFEKKKNVNNSTVIS